MNQNHLNNPKETKTDPEIIASHNFNDDRTVAFQKHKKKHKKDSIAWIVTGLLLFFFTFVSLGRITVIGQFFDDVIFNLIFGWFKFPMYLILIIIDISIYSGIRFKFKKRFIFMIASTALILCLYVSLALMIAIYDQQLVVGENLTIDKLWDKDSFSKLFQIYWEQWKVDSIFGPTYGVTTKMDFFISSSGYANLYNGGGVIGTLLAGCFSYLSIPGAIIVATFILFIDFVWIFTGDPFFLFKPKAKRKGRALRVLSLKSKHNPNPKNELQTTDQKHGMWKTLNVFDGSHNSEIGDSDLTIKLPSFDEETIELKLDEKSSMIDVDKHHDSDLSSIEPISEINDLKKELNNQKPFVFQSRRKTQLNPTPESATIEVVDAEGESNYGNLDPNEARKLFAHEANLTPFGPKDVKSAIQDSNMHDEEWKEELNVPFESNDESDDSDTLFFDNLYEDEQVVDSNKYQLPPIDLLRVISEDHVKDYENKQAAITKSQAINEVFNQFKIKAKVINIIIGPSVTKFEIQPEPGTKVNSMTSLENDLKLALATQNIRIEAPIQGKNLVGIEIPNTKLMMVSLREIMETIPKTSEAKLNVVLGKNVLGHPVVADLNKLPHLLIAGSTGSGKSVMINSLIISILMRATPSEVKFLMIDPKKIELSIYSNIPHMLQPVVYDVKAAIESLKMIVEEMDHRYQLFQDESVRNIESYNRKKTDTKDKLPFIVVIIDELADLFLNNDKKIIEELIMRIAQMARAAGIHLVLATQRPSVDVITGTIKANIPARIAFAVTTGADSRTILDSQGAEKLIGRGDMLFMRPGTSDLLRAQGAYLSDEEIENIVQFIEQQK
ncbi:DNA translocase FtsK [Williamsoniiplasma luminosum]|uniref:DNA translocase FtsK n=1 Tax=Williamsoniiplasma luminosum TaxID=214888 RepID=A0A2S0NJW1_9MOLU|nr:DNA translocase FtsK [Williamsoniiplasma luminosum]AVP49304.1 MAG: DNA translocase FtsK [Williamsoniiplasma luminosum]